MRLSQSLTMTTVPGLDPDEEYAEAEPYDWSEQPEVEDGDWPSSPTMLSMTVFDQSDRDAWDALRSDGLGATVEDSVLNGQFLKIPVDREQALLAAFETLGVAAVRDDTLISAIDAEG